MAELIAFHIKYKLGKIMAIKQPSPVLEAHCLRLYTSGIWEALG